MGIGSLRKVYLIRSQNFSQFIDALLLFLFHPQTVETEQTVRLPITPLSFDISAFEIQ